MLARLGPTGWLRAGRRRGARGGPRPACGAAADRPARQRPHHRPGRGRRRPRPTGARHRPASPISTPCAPPRHRRRPQRRDDRRAAGRPLMLPIVFHPDYLAPLRPGHRLPMSKYGYLRAALVARRLLPADRRLSRPGAAPASPAPRRCTPSPTSSGSRTRPSRPPRTAPSACPTPPPSPAAPSSPRAGTLLAARLALEHGLACNLAGGSHHAGPDGGAGFCVFNDVAIAAQALLDEGRVARSADRRLRRPPGRRHRPHLRRPRRGAHPVAARRAQLPRAQGRSDLDFPLPDGLGDRAYLEVLAHALAAGRALSCPISSSTTPASIRTARTGSAASALSDAGLRARDALVSAGRARAACRSRACSAAATTTTRPPRRPPRDPLRGSRPRRGMRSRLRLDGSCGYPNRKHRIRAAFPPHAKG